MTTRFAHPEKFAAGRIPIMSGAVMIGAIFPPDHSGDPWEWSIFAFGSRWRENGHAPTEEKARKAALDHWRGLLTDAELREVVS